MSVALGPGVAPAPILVPLEQRQHESLLPQPPLALVPPATPLEAAMRRQDIDLPHRPELWGTGR